jgi:hypothetical protein
MKSPFPGMDPFIEGCGLWEDFHAALVAEIKNALSLAVPERYVVRFGERSYVVLVDTEGKKTHPFLPDVRINSPGLESASGTGTLLADPATESEPVPMRPFIQEPFRESFVEILETDPDVRLVTSIEVLSPSNKRAGSPGWELYQRKRQGIFLGGVNLVEIDLLRGGQKMPMNDPWPDSPYTYLVHRSGIVPRCQAWRAHFRRSLPQLAVPLSHPDPDVALSVQPMVDRIYARSRYERSIDYTRPLSPPLSPVDVAWLEEQIRSRPNPT